MLDKLTEAFRASGSPLFSATLIKDSVSRTVRLVLSSNCHNSYSVAKVFTVTAIGLLFDEGKLSVDERAVDILSAYFPDGYDKRWNSVTVEHLLLHRFGILHGYLDIDCEDVDSYGTKDYLGYALSRRLECEPGTVRTYSDAAYYILSRIVAAKSGMDLCDYRMPSLFSKLGFKEVAWSKCPMGYSMGATGLYTSSEDMAKLGQVYLDGGKYNGEQIVSKQWVDTVLERGYELRKCDPDGKENYSKGGMNGQQLYISKTGGYVLAWHSFDTNDGCQRASRALRHNPYQNEKKRHTHCCLLKRYRAHLPDLQRII